MVIITIQLSLDRILNTNRGSYLKSNPFGKGSHLKCLPTSSTGVSGIPLPLRFVRSSVLDCTGDLIQIHCVFR